MGGIVNSVYNGLFLYEIWDIAFAMENGYLMVSGKGINMPRRARRHRLVQILLAGFCTIMFAMPAVAQQEFVSSLERGVLLVASPSLGDPNFEHTVLLIIEYGRSGTVGLILNRTTDVLLSDVLLDLPMLKRTRHRLFAGGPVGGTQLVLLFRLEGPYPDARSISGRIYVGTPGVLERILTQPKPTETFRAFAGFAGWAPGQLEQEILEGAWGVLQKNAIDIFDNDPAALWMDCIRRLQAPRSIANR